VTLSKKEAFKASFFVLCCGVDASQNLEAPAHQLTITNLPMTLREPIRV
jgi:hypothetical protein